MARTLRVSDCVHIPDGRIGRIREVSRGKYRVRVRRTTSATHQFLMFAASSLRRVDCPKGWMSLAGPQDHPGQDAATLGPIENSKVNLQDRTHSPPNAVFNNRPLQPAAIPRGGVTPLKTYRTQLLFKHGQPLTARGKNLRSESQ